MLISNEYKKMQAELHKNPNYGSSSTHFAPIVDDMIKQLNVKHLLDYGAGKCRLKDYIKSEVNYTPYEPSNSLWSQTPEPSEFVVCIDVLEHIEPECLENVLDDLKRVVDKHGLFTIHTGPAKKTLSDGRNAHLIQQPLEWWSSQLTTRFTILKQTKINNGCVMVVKNNGFR